MSSPFEEIRIVVPRKVADRLREVESKLNVKREDLIVRALMKVIEEMGG